MPDNKTVITADENDILMFADKIRQNKQEQSLFAANLHNVVKNNVRINKPLTIGVTPNSLVICKADPSLEFTISKTVIDKCLKPEIRDENGRLSGKTGHGLSEEQLLNALDNVKNPTMILQGNKPNSLVVITDLTDNSDRQILVSIMLNKMGSSAEINDVTSAYGRKDFANYIEEQVNSGKLLAMHTEKANKLFQSIGKKYPEPDKFIGFNDSIAYSDQNVKYPSKIFAFSEQEKSTVESISQQQDTSHITNADPAARRGERENTMSTKFEVSSITKLDGENGTKALASVAVNDEFIVSGISVRESREGNLYVQMPQQKNGVDEQGKDKYEDRVFLVSPDARKALDNAVLGAYENLNEKGLNNSYVNIEPSEKSASKLTVSLKKFNSEKSAVKAKGQITVDNCLVIKGVSVSQHTNSQTNEKFDKVNLPQFKQNSKGEYPPVVKPITAEFRKKLDNTVLGAFYSQTRGVNFSDLGGKDNTASFFRQNNEFAEKIMNELDNKGIPYHAKIDTLKKTTTISFKASDKAAVEGIKKSINEDEKKPSALGEISKIKEEKTQTEKAAPAKQQEKTQQKSNNNQEL